MDILTIVGIVMAFGAVVGGQALEGGHLASILQLTAFFIVMGGTIAAVCVQHPLPVLLRAISMLSIAIFDRKQDTKGHIKQILDLATLSRKQGLLALESQLKSLADPFFRKGVQLIVDGTEPKMVSEILDAEMSHQEEEDVTAAKVWEAAGGYAPTIGILGAVLGLIHVMENLADPAKLGTGIAVAFVATVYGVGSANLLFLPLANKLKLKVKQEVTARTVIIQGLVCLAQGENPRLIQEKLEGYLPVEQRTNKSV
jgi:chemotaxis protein MotA